MGVCSYCGKYRREREECFGWNEAKIFCGVTRSSRVDAQPLQASAPDKSSDNDLAMAKATAPMAETEWVLVPREPTEDQRIAGEEAYWAAPKGEDACTAMAASYRAMLSASPKPPHQEEGDVSELVENLRFRSGTRQFLVTEETALQAASALLSQASQIEALRKERDEALLCQKQIAAGSGQSATVARIIIAKNEAECRAEVSS